MERHEMINAELSEQELARVVGGGVDMDIFHDAQDQFPPTPTTAEQVGKHITKYRTVYEKAAATMFISGVVGGVLGGLGIHH